MKDTLRPGITGEKRIVVEPKHAISFMGANVPGVLASPWMLLQMEHAARESVLPHLEPGEDTVGVGFQFEHIAAAPISATVTASSELTAVDGRQLHFRIEARDEHEVIGRGTHVRAVVQVARFAERMRKKLQGKGDASVKS
jgi:predicted thioesterase